MKTAEEAVRALGTLADEDRRWILEQLPVAARMRLAELADDPHVEGASANATVFGRSPDLGHMPMDDFEWSQHVAELSAANPAAVSQALHSEPAWIVDAVLHAANWPWTQTVKKSLPVGMRADLASIERGGVRLAQPATRLLLKELANRSRDWPPAPEQTSRWKSLVGRLRGRVSR